MDPLSVGRHWHEKFGLPYTVCARCAEDIQSRDHSYVIYDQEMDVAQGMFCRACYEALTSPHKTEPFVPRANGRMRLRPRKELEA